jgi:hypothetical protein
MRMTDVDSTLLDEAGLGLPWRSTQPEDPTITDLKKLLATEKEPWKQNLTKWRMEYYLEGKNDPESPTIPLDARGNRKPVVDSETWIKQNPTLIQRGLVPNDALPPEAQQPGVLDQIKSGASAIGNTVKGIFKESTELDKLKDLTSKILKG